MRVLLSVVDRFRSEFVFSVFLVVMMCGVSPAGKPHLMSCLISSHLSVLLVPSAARRELIPQLLVADNNF